MAHSSVLPKTVLICHQEDSLIAEGLTAWLASSLDLGGIVLLRERPGALLRRVRREWRRVGPWRFLDVIAFRLYYRLVLARADTAWAQQELARLRTRYPADPDAVSRIVVADPNTTTVRNFLQQARPDLVIACCKVLLKREIFNIPRFGTFALHPGICPEYRNAHGCFWALANRDLTRVGMTLLRVDEGVDAGPIFLQASYAFDEICESPMVIQRRVVLENLETIASTLIGVYRGRSQPVSTYGRTSAVWGQPRLSAYWRWKSAARRAGHDARPARCPGQVFLKRKKSLLGLFGSFPKNS
jgi:folate-dependent phosphoribosylglycinamide formyltransferase PurN